MLNSAKGFCTLNKIQIICEFTNWLNFAEKGNSWANVWRWIFHAHCGREGFMSKGTAVGKDQGKGKCFRGRNA